MNQPIPNEADEILFDIYKCYIFCKNSELTISSLEELFTNLTFKENLHNDPLNHGIIGALEANNEEVANFILDYTNQTNLEAYFPSLITVLLFCIDKDNIKFINKILNYMDKNDIKSDEKFSYLQIIYNYTNTFNKQHLVNGLDETYSIVERSITNQMPERIILDNGRHYTWAIINNDGSLKIRREKGDFSSDMEKIKENYGINPILFNLNKATYKQLDTLLNNDYEIHPSIIKHAIVTNVYQNNPEAIEYLFSNTKCIKIIKESPEIKAFFNNNDDLLNTRKEVKSLLLKIEIDEELLDLNKTRKRIKI